MKKTINIFVIIAVFVVIISTIVAVLIFNLKNQDDQDNQDNQEDPMYSVVNVDLLRTDDYNKIVEYANKNKISIEKEEHLTTIRDVETYGRNITIYYIVDDANKISTAFGEFDAIESLEDLKDTDKRSEILRNEVYYVLNFFSQVLGNDVSTFNVFDKNGLLLSIADHETYEKILADEAEIFISIRDKEGTYWEITSDKDQRGRLRFKFFHTFDKEKFSGIVANNIIE